MRQTSALFRAVLLGLAMAAMVAVAAAGLPDGGRHVGGLPDIG